jgi:hypothetical protein
MHSDALRRRLTNALASGDDSRSLREGITTREAEVARLDRELARLSRTMPTQTPDAVVRQLEALLPDWRDVCGSTHPRRGRCSKAPTAAWS